MLDFINPEITKKATIRSAGRTAADVFILKFFYILIQMKLSEKKKFKFESFLLYIVQTNTITIMASTANFLWFLFLLITHTNAETELVSLPPDIFCDPLTEYFDSAGFKCTVCNDGSLNYLNKIPDTSSLDVYGNAMQCTCPVGLKKLPETCVVSDLQSGECYDFKCDDTCSEAVSLDKASCVTW